jgi:murein DD-endopeptidase MepM/ murein hydrolase activator NlpD
VPERTAIDFVRLDAGRRLFRGPIGRLSSYAYYGSQVLAVAGGTVVRVHEGEPEQTPPDFPQPFDPVTAPGNWILLRIGHGAYALYAHLQAGLRVHAGDRVRRGQVLALLGNTGSSTAPHLHLQVTNRPSPAAADGRPYVFRRFSSPGTVTDDGPLFAGRPTPIGPALAGSHRRQLPLNLQVVDFGAGVG